MKFCPVNVWFLLFAAGSLAQKLDLSDFFDSTPAPKNPEKPKANDDELNLFDAFGPDPEPKKPSKPAVGDTGDLDILDTLDFDKPAAPTDPKKPASGDDFGFDLSDALGPDPNPKPDKPVRPPSTGGGGSFDDLDLLDESAGGYKPDGGSSGGRAQNPDYDANSNKGGAGDNPQDLDLLWAKFLKMLIAKMPEEVFIWTSNLKQIFVPLLERAMELLETVQ